MMDDKELEQLRRKRMEELMNNQIAQEEVINNTINELEKEVQKYLEREAWSRLTNIKHINRELYLQAIYLIYQLGKAGRLRKPMCDDSLKKLLNEIIGKKREPKIMRR